MSLGRYNGRVVISALFSSRGGYPAQILCTFYLHVICIISAPFSLNF